MQWAAFLLALAWPLVKKVLIMLGIGAITYAGLSMIGTQVTQAVETSWGQLGGSTLQILSLAGIPQSFGILLGAINARIAFIAVGKIGRISGG